MGELPSSAFAVERHDLGLLEGSGLDDRPSFKAQKKGVIKLRTIGLKRYIFFVGAL
jgi:hypothetical protein